MAEQGIQRRLAEILVVDVVGPTAAGRSSAPITVFKFSIRTAPAPT